METEKETVKETAEIKQEGTHIFGLRTTANREDQVMDFLSSKLKKDDASGSYCVIRAHGMRGYIFVEAGSKNDVEQLASRIPYARGGRVGEINID